MGRKNVAQNVSVTASHWLH